MEQENPKWKDIEPSIWKPENDGDQITGHLHHTEPKQPGTDLSAKYYIETPDGTKMVWGSAVLDERMKFVQIGQKVRITYKGRKKTDKGREIKIFKVEVEE